VPTPVVPPPDGRYRERDTERTPRARPPKAPKR
jgi:hypothetical protein